MATKLHWRKQLKIKKMLSIGLNQREIVKALDCCPRVVQKYTRQLPRENSYVMLINYLNSIKVFE